MAVLKPSEKGQRAVTKAACECVRSSVVIKRNASKEVRILTEVLRDTVY
jgi:hypothetical protein